MGAAIAGRFPVMRGHAPAQSSPLDLLLANTWAPALAVTGAAGLPAPQDGGNVLRPRTTLKLSLRIPPTLDAGSGRGAGSSSCSRPTRRTGRGCASPRITPSPGWDAPATQPWLWRRCSRRRSATTGRPAMFTGLGGSIPFMAMLGERFPRAQFFITGTGGPGSNAHGPNEFLHLPFAERLTACVADLIAAHHRARTS